MSIFSKAFIREKWLHAGFQRYLKNTGWMFFGRMFTLGVSFLVSIYIARYIGPANYGLLNYAMSFVGLFGFLTSFGIDGILGREIIKDHNRKDELIGTGFYIKIIGSIIAIISIFIVSLFTTKDIFTLGLIWIFSLSFIPQAFNIIEIYFQSQVLSKKVAIAQIVSNIVSLILKLICISFDKGIFWLTLIYLVEASVYGLLLLISFRNFGNHIRKWKFNLSIAKSLLRDSWPLVITAVAVSIYMRIDQVMIKSMIGDEQAGIYAASTKISEIWYFIPSIICTSFFPSLINTLKSNVKLFEYRIKKLYFFMFWLSTAIALTLTILSPLIINTLFGELYIGAIPTLKIQAWSSISVFLGYVVSQHLLAENLTRISLYSTLLGAIVNIIINIQLIPNFGIIGASFATMISYTVATFGVLLFKKSRKQGMLILKSVINYK